MPPQAELFLTNFVMMALACAIGFWLGRRGSIWLRVYLALGAMAVIGLPFVRENFRSVESALGGAIYMGGAGALSLLIFVLFAWIAQRRAKPQA